MAENIVFLFLTTLIHNFYKFFMDKLGTKAFWLKKTSRKKAFVFKFISGERILVADFLAYIVPKHNE